MFNHVLNIHISLIFLSSTFSVLLGIEYAFFSFLFLLPQTKQKLAYKDIGASQNLHKICTLYFLIHIKL